MKKEKKDEKSVRRKRGKEKMRDGRRWIDG
jgi:hypothetical protein